jgi:hypothetical protein
MKRIISRCLLTVALVVSAPLSVLSLRESTAQEPARPAIGTPTGTRTATLPAWSAAAPQQVGSTGANFGIPDPLSQAEHGRDVRTRKLLSDYNRTDDEKARAKVLEELTNVVSEQFDGRQESRERELKAVEEHVRKLRELHQRRAKEKDQIVRDRVRQLLRDVDGLGWGDDDRQRPLFPQTSYYNTALPAEPKTQAAPAP